jgi:hypothetical protein
VVQWKYFIDGAELVGFVVETFVPLCHSYKVTLLDARTARHEIQNPLSTIPSNMRA